MGQGRCGEAAMVPRRGADLNKVAGGPVACAPRSSKTFAAQRCVLVARSPVLKAELCRGRRAVAASWEPPSEGASSTCTATWRPWRTLEALLHFVYTDTLPKMAAPPVIIALELIVEAADRFHLERGLGSSATTSWNGGG
uniref:BTB domain-containing protein n=1 Tax=Leersia perrieri TaxID=77586 RepID=A0A0D9XUI4_9ORYZ